RTDDRSHPPHTPRARTCGTADGDAGEDTRRPSSRKRTALARATGRRTPLRHPRSAAGTSRARTRFRLRWGVRTSVTDGPPAPRPNGLYRCRAGTRQPAGPAGRRGRAPLRTRDQRAQLGLLDHVARAAELADDLGPALVGEHVEQLRAPHGDDRGLDPLPAAPALEAERLLLEDAGREAGEEAREDGGRVEALAHEIARRRGRADVLLEAIDRARVGARH